MGGRLLDDIDLLALAKAGDVGALDALLTDALRRNELDVLLSSLALVEVQMLDLVALLRPEHPLTEEDWWALTDWLQENDWLIEEALITAIDLCLDRYWPDSLREGGLGRHWTHDVLSLKLRPTHKWWRIARGLRLESIEPNDRRLDLHGMALCEDVEPSTLTFEHLRAMTWLVFAGNLVPAHSELMGHILECCARDRVRHLEISGPIGGRCDRVLLEGGFVGLKVLVVTGDVDDLLWLTLGDFRETLETLDLSGATIPGDELELFFLVKWPQLQTLVLAGHVLGRTDIEVLCDKKNFGALRKLNINRCGVDDEGAALLAASEVVKGLASLHCLANPMTEAGRQILLSAREVKDGVNVGWVRLPYAVSVGTAVQVRLREEARRGFRYYSDWTQERIERVRKLARQHTRGQAPPAFTAREEFWDTFRDAFSAHAAELICPSRWGHREDLREFVSLLGELIDPEWALNARKPLDMCGDDALSVWMQQQKNVGVLSRLEIQRQGPEWTRGLRAAALMGASAWADRSQAERTLDWIKQHKTTQFAVMMAAAIQGRFRSSHIDSRGYEKPCPAFLSARWFEMMKNALGIPNKEGAP
jgi:hypothetical protein